MAGRLKGRVRAALAAAALLLAPGAAWTQAAPTASPNAAPAPAPDPARPATTVASPPPPKDSPECKTVTSGFHPDRGAYAALPHLEMFAPTPRMSEGWENVLLIRLPKALSEVDNIGIQTFVASRPDSATGRWRMDTLRLKRPDEELQKRLNIPDPGSWLEVQVDGVDARPIWRAWSLYETRDVYAAVCDGSRVVAVAKAKVRWVNFYTAQAVAVGVALVIYLAAAFAVRSARLRAFDASNGAQQPPLRLKPLTRPTWWESVSPVVITADTYGKGSLSKLQILVFTMVVVGGLTMVLLLKGALLDLSESIVALLGLPAAGSILSQMAGMSRDRLSTKNWSWLVSRGVLPTNDPNPEAPSWRELFMTHEELDLYKIQAAAFSIVVIIAMLMAMAKLDSFEVPSSLLYALGLSQVLLVGGRFAKPATMADLDNLITELKVRERALKLAAKTGIDVDADGKPLSMVDAAGNPIAPAAQSASLAQAQVNVPMAAGRYIEVVKEAEILLEGLTGRDVDVSALMAPQLP